MDSSSFEDISEEDSNSSVEEVNKQQKLLMDSSLSEIISGEASSSSVEEVNQQKQQQRCTFSEEAFIYLFDHFGIRAKPQGSKLRFFSDAAGEAVATIAYTYRKRLRTLFRSVSVDFADANEFKKFAENFELIEDECYFYRILKRISHIFELAVYCLNEGYDYIETAREIDLFGDSADYFEVAGGLNRLNRTAGFISNVGVVLYRAIKAEKPQDAELSSFVTVVQALETPQEDSEAPVKRGMLSVIKNRINSKIPNADDLDVRVARVFYHIICQHTSKVIAVSRKSRLSNMYWREKQYVSVDLETRAIIESLRVAIRIIFGKTDFFNLEASIKLAECFAALRHLTDLISPVLDNAPAIPEREVPPELSEEGRDCYSLKEYFIVSDNYVTEREKGLVESAGQSILPESSYEQPTRQKMHRKRLRKVIDANIQQRNYFQLNDGRYVVHTPDCTFDLTTTTVLFS